MPAYAIFIREKTTDPAELKTYSAKAGAARGDHKITPLAFYGPHEALEGQDAEAVAILQFESRDAIKAWYNSPAYQEALQHRLKGADYRLLIVDGL